MSVPALARSASTFLSFFERNAATSVSPSASLDAGWRSHADVRERGHGAVQDARCSARRAARLQARATSSQRCLRVSGKHNDHRGTSGARARHQTFFEMLGNFSLGDYFKQECHRLCLGAPRRRSSALTPERLAVATVFRGRRRSLPSIWAERHRPTRRRRSIRLNDEAENFWAMGETGPCGPCSEIHVDYGAQRHDCTSSGLRSVV